MSERLGEGAVAGGRPVDVAIVGGGIMGSAVAYWLTELDPGLAVTVFERDTSYATASSTLSAASIRQQFTTGLNVRISLASIAFLRGARMHLEVDGQAPDLGLRESGYLYLATPAGYAAMRSAHAVQVHEGADVAILEPAALAQRFPWLAVDGLAAGSLGLSGEGWFDAHALLAGFQRRARSRGARFVRAEVIGASVAADRVASLTLEDGTRIDCGHVVNAAGPWARRVAAMLGLDLPIHARRRTVYVVACPARIERCPLVVDPSGFWVRPEGVHYLAGLPPAEDPDDAPLEPEYGAFEETLWPALARRIPGFEAARLVRAWAGYYDMNLFDHNAIVGAHPGIANAWLINGFSGHGLQQAPVAARGLAELIVAGRYLSLDLSALGAERIALGCPMLEHHVIG